MLANGRGLNLVRIGGIGPLGNDLAIVSIPIVLLGMRFINDHHRDID
jgi:hypothetical protein